MGSPILWLLLAILGVDERRPESLHIAWALAIIAAIGIGGGALWFLITKAFGA